MRKLINLSDKELLSSISKGHHQAFDVLFLRYKSDLQKVILHYIKDKLFAEDLLQDAFIKIYTSLCAGRYSEEGKFLPWALRIAHNLCMDHLRKSKRLNIFPGGADKDLSHLHADTYVDTKMINKQEHHQLHRLLHHLSDDQKKVVTYRYFEEMSFKEISALMNTSVNTSLGRMRYALLHLRKEISSDQSFVWR